DHPGHAIGRRQRLATDGVDLGHLARGQAGRHPDPVREPPIPLEPADRVAGLDDQEGRAVGHGGGLRPGPRRGEPVRDGAWAYTSPLFRSAIKPMTGPTFQGLIQALNAYWAEQGCVLIQPLDLEVGAGTFHPATFLRALGPEPWNAAYVQPSRRPTD